LSPPGPGGEVHRDQDRRGPGQGRSDQAGDDPVHHSSGHADVLRLGQEADPRAELPPKEPPGQLVHLSGQAAEGGARVHRLLQHQLLEVPRGHLLGHHLAAEATGRRTEVVAGGDHLQGDRGPEQRGRRPGKGDPEIAEHEQGVAEQVGIHGAVGPDGPAEQAGELAVEGSSSIRFA
jgi:hypothetical protein